MLFRKGLAALVLLLLLTPLSAALADHAIGSTVFFGAYPQGAWDSKKPIEWIVLDCAEDGSLLLLSRYALDAQPYHVPYGKVTWAKSTLRAWLNGDFLSAAFTQEEQAAILLTNVSNAADQGNALWDTNGGEDTQDFIFLLSRSEALLYFADYESRACQPTAYACNRGVWKSSINGHCWWWLRSPGPYDSTAMRVHDLGTVGEGNAIVDNNDIGVRPALWLDPQKAVL